MRLSFFKKILSSNTIHDKGEIFLTHSSDEYREVFTSKDKIRPTFYWFTDRYFDHLAGCKYPAWDYFYVFIKNPKEDKMS